MSTERYFCAGAQALAQVRNCDAVLDIIDTVIRSNSCDSFAPSSISDPTRSTLTLSSDTPSSPVPSATSLSLSHLLIPNTLQSSTCTIKSLPAPRTLPPNGRKRQNRSVSESCIDFEIGELGKRRGFKGAPLRTRGASLSQKLSSSILSPFSPITSKLAHVTSSPSAIDLHDVGQDDFMNLNPFADKFASSYYVPDTFTADILPANLDNFSVYRSRPSLRTALGHTSTRSRKNLFYNQTTDVYDMSIYSYGMVPFRPRRYSWHPERKLTSSSDSSNEATPVSIDSPATTLEVETSVPVSPTDNTDRPIDSESSVAQTSAQHRRIPALRPLILPQRHNLTAQPLESVRSVSNADCRPQALVEIIDLLNFESTSEILGRNEGPEIGTEEQQGSPAPGRTSETETITGNGGTAGGFGEVYAI